MSASVAQTAGIVRLGFDKLGVVIAALIVVGAASPLAVFRANRIVAGEAKSFLDALPPLAAALFGWRRSPPALFRFCGQRPRLRLATAVGLAIAVAALIGIARQSFDLALRPLRPGRASRGLLVAGFRGFDPFRQFRRASEVRPPRARPDPRARRRSLRADAGIRRLEPIVDSQGICVARGRFSGARPASISFSRSVRSPRR